MADGKFGEPVEGNFPHVVTFDGSEALGFRWKVSDETRREIEKIEANVRIAEQKSGTIILR